MLNHIASGKTHQAMFRRKTIDSLEEAETCPAVVRRLKLIHRDLDFEAFSALLPRLVNVREISLGWQTWTTLPQGLSELRELRSFTVTNTPLESFPAFLASCPRLNELVLRGTEITAIPVSVAAFRHLHRLDFSNNPVREIPPELGQLSGLRELQLADNGLRTLPAAVAALRRLRRLLLAGNCFNTVEAARIRGWFRRGVVSVWATGELDA